jgi:hypothetical protein
VIEVIAVTIDLPCRQGRNERIDYDEPHPVLAGGLGDPIDVTGKAHKVGSAIVLGGHDPHPR